MRDRICKYFSAKQTHADVILYPSVSLMPPKISDIHGPEWTIKHNGQQISQFLITTKNADVASVANLPAITLPSISKPSSSNMPIGIEIAGMTGRDRHLIAVARAIEKVVLGTYV